MSIHKRVYTIIFSFIIVSNIFSQKIKLSGIYAQWGYNEEWYTKSNIHFKMANGDDFVVHGAKAHNKPDFGSILSSPIDVSIPQYNMRLGLYLNENHSKGIEVNFDHTKYVVSDYQTAQVTGNLDGKRIDSNVVLDPNTFLHFEHTDGANFLHFNYFEQYSLKKSKKTSRNVFTYLWKAGVGFNIPRTDFTWRGNELNNKFHIAGYNMSAESGVRYYPFRNFFFEATLKSGYVRYVDALADTKTDKGNRASHGFGYFEVIATIGYDINFIKKSK